MEAEVGRQAAIFEQIVIELRLQARQLLLALNQGRVDLAYAHEDHNAKLIFEELRQRREGCEPQSVEPVNQEDCRGSVGVARARLSCRGAEKLRQNVRFELFDPLGDALVMV